MRRTQVILFDLDNTLYHYDPCDAAALRAVHEQCAGTYGQSFEDFMILHNQARSFFADRLKGNPSSHNRLLFFKRMLESLGAPQAPVTALEWHANYWQTFFATMRPHADARRVLDALGQRYALALVTNQVAWCQYEKVRRLGFEDDFRHVIASEEAGQDKPHSDVFAYALERLGVEADSAVMVGDQPRGDIAGAKRLGIETVYTHEYTGRDEPPAEADHVISRLDQVLDILL